MRTLERPAEVRGADTQVAGTGGRGRRPSRRCEYEEGPDAQRRGSPREGSSPCGERGQAGLPGPDTAAT